MPRSLKILLPLLVLLLLALLGAGWWAQTTVQATREELRGQQEIAGQLLALQEAAGDKYPELASSLAGSLDSLAPAAVEQAQKPATSGIQEQLDTSAEALLALGLDTENLQERALALTALADIWQAARADGITDEPLPTALNDRINNLAPQACPLSSPSPQSEKTQDAQEAPAVPAPLTALQDTYYTLNYVSEFYQARSDQGYEALSERTEALASSSQAYLNQLAPALACYGYTAPEAPSYPVLPAGEAAAQLDGLEKTARVQARALLADETLPHGADSLEALALAAALAEEPATSR